MLTPSCFSQTERLTSLRNVETETAAALDNSRLTLKSYCTFFVFCLFVCFFIYFFFSFFPEILQINRSLREKQIVETPIKNANPNCNYLHLNFI